MNPKIQAILDLEQERDKYIIESDYWHDVRHQFCLKNKMESRVDWADFPDQYRFYFSIIENYDGIINEFNKRIFLLADNLSEDEKEDLHPGWEDKYLDNWESILK